MSSIGSDLLVLFPECLLALAAMGLLMIGAVWSRSTFRLVSIAAVCALVAAGWFVFSPLTGAEHAFGGAFVADGFSRFAKILVLLGSALTLIMSVEFLERENIANFEFPVLVLLATVGMLFMVSAANFIALYLGFELQSLSLYVLAASNRDSVRSSEAGLKYFVLGALSSGMMLYGISFIYGFAGTTSFAAVAHAVLGAGGNIGVIFGLVFLIVGLAFKVSAVPFHMWTPDVYEGSPTPITAFFSMAPKTAAMALFLRVMLIAMPGVLPDWRQIVAFVSVLSMFLGAVAAIGQTNIKRLMAYSSISHMGYALIGLAAGTTQGVQSVLLYLAVYVITNAGVFVCILAMRRGQEMVETIPDLAGLARTNPRLALAFAVLFISLAGIPPFAGFFAKFYVFLAAIQTHLYALAVLGVLSSVIGAYYYLRIVKIMYFDEPAPAFERNMGTPFGAIAAASSLFNAFFVVIASPLVGWAIVAAKAFGS
ncbi:MAG TPA: NADH-quinone oxidoreductase subunit NuoN [Rhizomicrobium sp.]|nr:NADH-quinone oxidoreductase subunit NuoN [Rhizomicrobium sp.]